MIPYLSFDSKSIKHILSLKKHHSCPDEHDSDFPLFFKGKKGTTAIDVALEYNQIKSVN